MPQSPCFTTREGPQCSQGQMQNLIKEEIFPVSGVRGERGTGVGVVEKRVVGGGRDKGGGDGESFG